LYIEVADMRFVTHEAGTFLEVVQRDDLAPKSPEDLPVGLLPQPPAASGRTARLGRLRLASEKRAVNSRVTEKLCSDSEAPRLQAEEELLYEEASER
jgi:hypothetical protein